MEFALLWCECVTTERQNIIKECSSRIDIMNNLKVFINIVFRYIDD